MSEFSEDNPPFIGQRVLMTSMINKHLVTEICTIVPSENGYTTFGAWVFSPSKGYASDYAFSSFKPLPNGQL